MQLVLLKLRDTQNTLMHFSISWHGSLYRAIVFLSTNSTEVKVTVLPFSYKFKRECLLYEKLLISVRLTDTC